MPESLDRTTFEKLFREEFKGLVLFAIQYVKDYEAAREIVQEAYMGLWNQRERIDPARSVKTYLSTTVRNRSLNHLRNNKKFDTRLLTLENLYPLTSYVPPDRLVEKELHDRIQGAIAELPDKCREVFLLSRNEHLKYQAIADRLQISVKTVETQMSKALQHLRNRLKEYLVVVIFSVGSWQLAVGSTPSPVTSHESRFKVHESQVNVHDSPIRVLPVSCVVIMDKWTHTTHIPPI